MSALDGHWLPALDPVTGMLALPLWIIGAIAALFVVVCVLAFNRTAATGPVVMVIRYAVVLVAVLLAWAVIDRSAVRERTADRRALEARAFELTARAITPGSALACLDASTGEAVERACEKALFATPESVAAAVAYVGAKLSLLADGLDYAKRVDGSYAAQLVSLRRAAETDRFGLVAHVLATRDGCTAETCAAFKLLQDTSRVSANLKENALEGYVTRHAANWPKNGATFSTASTPPAPSGPTITNSYSFPSAASIPPVSIMTAEPPAPPLAAPAAAPPPTAEPIVNPPSPPRKPPQASAPPKKPPPPRVPQPGQGAPPATSGNAPPTPTPGGQPRAQ